MRCHSQYNNALQSNYRKFLGITLVQWFYRKHKKDQTYMDFKSMYNMGNEL